MSYRVSVATVLVAVSFQSSLSRTSRADEILASGFFSDTVGRYDAARGTFLGTIDPAAVLDGVLGFSRGPDGHLYVCSELTNEVVRFTWPQGELIDVFVAPGHGLDGPTSAIFGPDLTGDGEADLFVASFESDAVLLYDGASGSFVDTFVASGAGGLDGPDVGMTFGPDGNLYVPSYWSNSIACFDGTSGAALDPFVPPGGGGLARPRTIVFRTDGRALVTSEANARVIEYAADGTPLGPLLVGVPAPSGLVLETTGTVLVSSVSGDFVRRFDGTTGAYVGEAVPAGAGGLDAPTFVLSIVAGDVTGDGLVGVPDLLAVLAAWGPCPALPAGCRADLDGSGAVDVGDVLAVLAHWE